MFQNSLNFQVVQLKFQPETIQHHGMHFKVNFPLADETGTWQLTGGGCQVLAGAR